MNEDEKVISILCVVLSIMLLYSGYQGIIREEIIEDQEHTIKKLNATLNYDTLSPYPVINKSTKTTIVYKNGNEDYTETIYYITVKYGDESRTHKTTNKTLYDQYKVGDTACFKLKDFW